jgi:hypothetical protein
MPWRTMSASGTRPVPYAMALHGVDTGKRKPSDAPMVAATTGSVGSMPAERANAITTGTTMFADAVLLVVSDSTVASSEDDRRQEEAREHAHASATLLDRLHAPPALAVGRRRGRLSC